MNSAIEDWYKSTMKLIKAAEKSGEKSLELNDMIGEWKAALEIMESQCQGIKEKIENDDKIRGSFTNQQMDFICHQIGEWYLEWKDKVVTDPEHDTHKLGYAKERLKEMICGD